jgi:hypothetical protein
MIFTTQKRQTGIDDIDISLAGDLVLSSLPMSANTVITLPFQLG